MASDKNTPEKYKAIEGFLKKGQRNKDFFPPKTEAATQEELNEVENALVLLFKEARKLIVHLNEQENGLRKLSETEIDNAAIAAVTDAVARTEQQKGGEEG